MELSFGGKESKKKGKVNEIRFRERPISACRGSTTFTCPCFLL